mmetsp:Transcript_15206/g.22111  ORF Transcript_15206/g.22111 Transcript_15206/m.22111 type:complete len:429 (+) Transcript_15206:1-1287(+)
MAEPRTIVFICHEEETRSPHTCDSLSGVCQSLLEVYMTQGLSQPKLCLSPELNSLDIGEKLIQLFNISKLSVEPDLGSEKVDPNYLDTLEQFPEIKEKLGTDQPPFSGGEFRTRVIKGFQNSLTPGESTIFVIPKKAAETITAKLNIPVPGKEFFFLIERGGRFEPKMNLDSKSSRFCQEVAFEVLKHISSNQHFREITCKNQRIFQSQKVESQESLIPSLDSAAKNIEEATNQLRNKIEASEGQEELPKEFEISRVTLDKEFDYHNIEVQNKSATNYNNLDFAVVFKGEKETVMKIFRIQNLPSLSREAFKVYIPSHWFIRHKNLELALYCGEEKVYGDYFLGIAHIKEVFEKNGRLSAIISNNIRVMLKMNLVGKDQNKTVFEKEVAVKPSGTTFVEVDLPSKGTELKIYLNYENCRASNKYTFKN